MLNTFFWCPKWEAERNTCCIGLNCRSNPDISDEMVRKQKNGNRDRKIRIIFFHMRIYGIIEDGSRPGRGHREVVVVLVFTGLSSNQEELGKQTTPNQEREMRELKTENQLKNKKMVTLRSSAYLLAAETTDSLGLACWR
ncbi:hypothetical protein JTB14_011678 [Gonioctena quinquepunctata]|nr:hypothetical protein JTB14_011678 [Gonioctena quinquepunctata]